MRQDVHERHRRPVRVEVDGAEHLQRELLEVARGTRRPADRRQRELQEPDLARPTDAKPLDGRLEAGECAREIGWRLTACQPHHDSHAAPSRSRVVTVGIAGPSRSVFVIPIPGEQTTNELLAE